MLTLIAAESGTSFSAGQLGSAIGILLFGLTAIIAWRKVFGHEPPLHKEYVSRQEHQALKEEVTKIDNERRTSVANLHTKIDANTSVTAATNATVNQMNVQLQQLNTHLLNQASKK